MSLPVSMAGALDPCTHGSTAVDVTFRDTSSRPSSRNGAEQMI